MPQGTNHFTLLTVMCHVPHDWFLPSKVPVYRFTLGINPCFAIEKKPIQLWPAGIFCQRKEELKVVKGALHPSKEEIL